jgi:hypothetical protein
MQNQPHFTTDIYGWEECPPYSQTVAASTKQLRPHPKRSGSLPDQRLVQEKTDALLIGVVARNEDVGKTPSTLNILGRILG